MKTRRGHENCPADSDGDGRSNGEELGDPRCVWTPGTTPEKTTGITHPGICEPLDGEECRMKLFPATAGEAYKYQRDWMAAACKNDEFVCQHLNTTVDVRKAKLRIPLTPVPAKETTYMCAFFDFENVTTDFHNIATTPIINNSYVLHHMLLFGCPDGYTRNNLGVKEPFECNMGGCYNIIGAWTLGLSGQCFHPQAGYRVGKTGYKKMMIQYHWNNPMARTDFVDSSGLTLYYTPNLRPHNMGTLMTGQQYLEIPPYTELTIATSDCSGTCTKTLLKGDIYVTEASNHMHYLGKSMYLEHHRDGQKLRYLTKDTAFNYDNTTFYRFEEPVLVKPGDMIRTSCHFKSTDKSTTTFEGDSTSDEMCFGFLWFYPADNMPVQRCVSAWKTVIECDPNTLKRCDRFERNKYRRALNTTSLYQNITTSCMPYGVCKQECKAAIKAAMASEACLQHPDTWDYVKHQYLPWHDAGRTLLASMLSCEVDIYKDTIAAANPASPADVTAGAACMEAASVLALFPLMTSAFVVWSPW